MRGVWVYGNWVWVQNRVAYETVQRDPRLGLLETLITTKDPTPPCWLAKLRWLEPGALLGISNVNGENDIARPPGQGTRQIHVDPTGTGGAFSSIGEALKASTPGTSVFVHRGVYHEHIVIPDLVELHGEGSELVRICGALYSTANTSTSQDDQVRSTITTNRIVFVLWFKSVLTVVFLIVLDIIRTDVLI